jgi:hypothetical protein
MKKELEEMNLAEMKAKATELKLTFKEDITIPELMNAIMLKEFASNRGNQFDAIVSARTVKDAMEGQWFTALQLSKKMKGSLTSVNNTLIVLGLFGMVKKKVNYGKQDKYKINLHGATKAMIDHEKNMKAVNIISSNKEG